MNIVIFHNKVLNEKYFEFQNGPSRGIQQNGFPLLLEKNRKGVSMQGHQIIFCSTTQMLPAIRTFLDNNNAILGQVILDSEQQFNYVKNQIIRPLKNKLDLWRNGGMCQGCQQGYDQRHFGGCLDQFNKLLGNQVRIARMHAVRSSMRHFADELTTFEAYKNCLANRWP